MNLRNLAILATAAMAVTGARAEQITFKVGAGTPAQQIAQVESVTDFETFTGRSDAVTGTIMFDPVKRTGGGKLSIEVKSIATGIGARDEHLQSPTWLDAAKYPTITFESTKVQSIGKDRYRVTGKFTMHGVTKPVTTTITAKYLKESAATRAANFKGHVLQVRATFPVKLSDYKVQIPPIAKGKVAPTVTISIAVYAQSKA